MCRKDSCSYLVLHHSYRLIGDGMGGRGKRKGGRDGKRDVECREGKKSSMIRKG